MSSIRLSSNIRIAAIKRRVAARFRVTVGEIDGPRRVPHIVRPRHVAMYLARKLTFHSLPEIGGAFGNRDHTTVLAAVRHIEKLLGGDYQVTDQAIEEICDLRDLREPAPPHRVTAGRQEANGEKRVDKPAAAPTAVVSDDRRMAKPRSCLGVGCGVIFLSQHAGNRLCDRCQRTHTRVARIKQPVEAISA